LPEVCDQLAFRGTRVIIAGLDMDYTAKPFGQMPNLLAKAEYITKLHAICVKCGNIANYSYRKQPTGGRILLGETDLYEPRCRNCYFNPDC
jgi:thymidine kinase